MKINNLQGSTFGRLIVSENVTKQLTKKGKSGQFYQHYNEIKNYIEQNNLDKKKFVDIILDCKECYNDKFIGIVSGKKYGIPSDPDQAYNIKPDKKSLKGLKNWLNDWNHEYTPKFMRKWEF